MVIEGADCDSCVGGDETKYNPVSGPQKSTVFKRLSNELQDFQYQQFYGTEMHLKGVMIEDQVCLMSFSNCVDPFQFVLLQY